MIVGCNCSKVVEHGSKHLTCVSNGQDCLYFYGFCPPMLVLTNEGSAATKWLICFILCLLCAAGLSEFSIVEFSEIWMWRKVGLSVHQWSASKVPIGHWRNERLEHYHWCCFLNMLPSYSWFPHCLGWRFIDIIKVAHEDINTNLTSKCLWWVLLVEKHVTKSWIIPVLRKLGINLLEFVF
jgi:hypothetical protein